MTHCSLAAILEVAVPTGWYHVALSIGNININTSLQLQKFSRECPFCTLTAKIFLLESFAVYGTVKMPSIVK